MSALLRQMLGSVTCGDCVDVMDYMPAACVDFILTDPPYGVRYRDRSGRRVANDGDLAWLPAAFAQMHRVLNENCICISFYGWTKADAFLTAARAAGFRSAGHIVFPKRYASSSRFLRYHHEQAYLFAKGDPPIPDSPPSDVIDGWRYTGNRLHPTQKPVEILRPLVTAFTAPHAVVLDPFCGSGSTLIAARDCGRRFVGIELDPAHHQTARNRLRHAATGT